MKEFEKSIDSTWSRLGLRAAPDPTTSGKGIGIIILDEVISHSSISHLGDRIKKITVHDDLTVSCIDITAEKPKEICRNTEHGMKVIQLLAHQPFENGGTVHVGLSPSATFIFLAELEPEKITTGLAWILRRQDEWNIRILLNLLVPNTRMMGSMKSTSSDPYVKAMEPAHRADLFIIAANGNSKAHNNLHPIHFFAVGGYDDGGSADFKEHQPHPAVPWGRNGDGHIRPDILAPFTYLPVPHFDRNDASQTLSFFGGSCGAATLVAGVSAYLLANFSSLNNTDLRNLLIRFGKRMEHYDNPAPKLHVGEVIEALANGVDVANHSNVSAKHHAIGDELTLLSMDSVERAVAVTEMIEQHRCTRSSLWGYLNDPSPIVRKTVISFGLRAPKDKAERRAYWRHFHQSERETGEKISWLYQLLSESTENELDQWMGLLKEKDIEITLCVKIYMEKHFKDAPEIEYSPDPNPSTISRNTAPLLRWYDDYTKRYGGCRNLSPI